MFREMKYLYYEFIYIKLERESYSFSVDCKFLDFYICIFNVLKSNLILFGGF